MKRCVIHNSAEYSGKRKLKNSSQQLGYDLAGPIMQKYKKSYESACKVIDIVDFLHSMLYNISRKELCLYEENVTTFR